MPRVVKGVPSSWNQPLTIKTNHKFSTWSPCGKFLAVVTPNEVEIWDTLTLGKRSTLRPTNPSHKLWDIHRKGIPGGSPNGVAYSPDGCSLACYSSFSTTIIIWDIQTGGVVNEIECGAIGTTFESLVWFFDGVAIGAILTDGQDWVVCVCNVALGTMVSPGTLQSFHKPHLWPHHKLLRALTMLDHGHICFEIYEIGPTLLRIKIFSITLPANSTPKTISFSPTTNQVSIITNKHVHFVFGGQNSEVLLERVHFSENCFSPDGSLIAAFEKGAIHIWQYKFDCYNLWRRVPFWSNSEDIIQGFQFSPTSPSVLISREGFLEVVHLGDPEANYPTKPTPQYGEISTDGTYIVTAEKDGNIIRVTNFCSQIPSWSIHSNSYIWGLALTGNILLMDGRDKISAWRLTAEGAVEGALGNQMALLDDQMELRADEHHEIWSAEFSESGTVKSRVTGETGIISFGMNDHIYYNTRTGERAKLPRQTSIYSAPSHDLSNLSFHTHLCYHRFHVHNNPPEDNQPTSIPSYKEGWVKYPEGEHPHRFWLPPHWMADCGENAYWVDDITTLWLHRNELVVIKF
jgi:WD40 repeat protein